MNHELLHGAFESTSGLADIAYYIYKPKCEIRAVLQLSHGMCEFVERYEVFADFMCENGILVCGNDHLGHGGSVKELSELGYFGETNGYQYMVTDLKRLKDIVKAEYNGLPYFLLGHSMGSFLARIYLADYGNEIDAAIITGTGGGVAGVPLMQAFLHLLKRLYGSHHRSRFISNCATTVYNHRIKNRRTPCDWVSCDPATVDFFIANKYCNFIFTLSGYEELVLMQKYANSRKCAKKTPKNLPILFMSGENDPIGNYGKGVVRAVRRYRRFGCTNISIRLYDGARHEIANETNKREIYGDIYSYIHRKIPE